MNQLLLPFDQPPRPSPIAHTVVLASAGTGKTFTLTTRFIALLARAESPDRILATTFTRKAAGEILTKVIQRLADAAQSDAAARKLGAHIGVESLSARSCLVLLRSLVSNLHRLGICTLDALFLRIATAFAMELGGEGARDQAGAASSNVGSWRMLDDDEQAGLRDRAVTHLLRRADPDDLHALIRILAGESAARPVHAAIQRVIEETYPVFLAAEPTAWAALSPPPPLSETELPAAIRALERLPIPASLAGPSKSWQAARDKAIESIRAGDWDAFISAGIAPKVVNGETHFSRQEIPRAVREIFQPLIRQAAAVLLGALARRTEATGRLLATFHNAYARIKREAGGVTFDDVPRLIAGCVQGTGLDNLYYRLDSRFAHILLDEFQDTSLAQWNILDPLVEEIVSQEAGVGAAEGSGGGGGRSFLCVGDVKQSLYRWRDAEPDLLPSLLKRWTHLVEQPLHKSFRSSPVIIDTVNRVLGPALPDCGVFESDKHPGDLAVARRWSNEFPEHTVDESRRALPGYACLRVAPAPAQSDAPAPDTRHSAPGTRHPASQTLQTLRFAAQRIREIRDAAPDRTIGVLFRSRTPIPRLKYELQRLEVAASEEGGNPLTDSMPVAVAMSMLTLADHPGNSAAAFHVATSPLGPALGLSRDAFPDDLRRLASRTRRDLLLHGYADTLERWFAAIAPSCDQRDAQRFDQLINLAQSFDDRSTSAANPSAALRPADFVDLVHSRHVEDPGAASVRLMTIHASKGLEFDTVILPELEPRLVPNRPVALTRRDGPLGRVTAVSLYAPGEVRALDPDLQAMHADWRAKQLGESLCILYVALTRARHALEMIVPPSDKPGASLTFAGVLRATLAPGRRADPGTILWQHGDPDWSRHRRDDDRSKPAPRPAPPPLRLKVDTAGHAPRHLSRVSPSSALRSPARALRLALQPLDEPGSAAARARGELFHKWLELIEWLDDATPSDDQLLAAARALHLDAGADPAQLIPAFRAALARPSLSEALSRRAFERPRPGAARLAVWREREFAVTLPGAPGESPSLITGRFDRLVIARDRAGAITSVDIIDFKTDSIDLTDAALVAERRAIYAPQLDAYKRAATRILGVDPAIVHADIVFV